MQNYYRIISGSVLVLIMISLSIAQNPIPNPGFEDWTGGNPDSWITSNVPGVYSPVTASELSHSGTYAVKGEVLDFIGFGLPPAIISDTTGGGFTVSQNYTRMTGYYQFTNMGQDVLYAVVFLLDMQGGEVAAGGAELGATTSGYTPFTVDLSYEGGSGQQAALAYVLFGITTAEEATIDTITPGSFFLIDDLAFDLVNAIDNLSGINTVDNFVLEQNYPNPFNPVTKISFSLPQAEFVRLTVFNSLGQEVQQLVNKALPAGNHTVTFNAADFPSGIYFYRIEAGQYNDLKKMVLVK